MVIAKEGILPNPRDGHESQPSLGDESNDSGHPDTTVIPLRADITLPYMEHDERESVNQSKHEHGPGHPVMPDVQLLMRDTSQGSDRVRLRSKDNQERHAGKGHEAGTGGDGWRVAIADLLGIRPVIRLRSESHGEEVNQACASEEKSTQ